MFVAAGSLTAALAGAAGVGSAELAQAGWLGALQLWFLPVYLLLIALTPALLAAHRRGGLVHRYLVDMIGSGNTNPPSIALLPYAAAQFGLVMAAEPAAARLLARPRLWRRVRRLNATTMTVYLWHFVPVITIAVAFYPTGVMGQPAIGTARWWGLRLAW